MVDQIITIFPHKYSEYELKTFTEQLFKLHCKIFSGVDKETFEHYVVKSPASFTKIRILKSKGIWVGYVAVHYFNINIEGRNIVVLRGETGVQREYRKQINATKIVIHEALRCKLKNIGKKVIVLGCFVNPVMYYALAKLLYEIYPNCRRPTPISTIMLMEKLAEIFHLEKVNEENPFVRKVGWQVKEQLNEHTAALHSNKPEILFFIQQNPSYNEGYGLEIIVPVTFANLFISFYNSIIVQLKPQWRYFKNLFEVSA